MSASISAGSKIPKESPTSNINEEAQDNTGSNIPKKGPEADTNKKQPTDNAAHSKGDNAQQNAHKHGCLKRLSSWIATVLESAFYKLGMFVSLHPVPVILVNCALCGLCGVGLLAFDDSATEEELWVPQSARVIAEKAWVDRTFPLLARMTTFITVSEDNVLTPTFINSLMDYYTESKKIKVNGKGLDDLCLKVGESYCHVQCLLELWQFNETKIRALSQTDIIRAVNNEIPLSGENPLTLLGGDVEKTENGVRVRATATTIRWLLKRKHGDESDAADFEKEMINIGRGGHSNISSTYYYAHRSFKDEGIGPIYDDLDLLFLGFLLVYIYVFINLGRRNLLQHKIYLSLCGLFIIGLSIVVSFGLASAMNVIFSPVHHLLPFLLLGLGVDDMFVIVETLWNLSPSEQSLDVHQRMALTLSHAGVSISVTSLTDAAAFAIGATTVIPAISGFCLYATLGVLALFWLVNTVFMACLTLDEMRLSARRDACLVCYTHPEGYQSSSCSQKSLTKTFFADYFGPFIMRPPVKIIIIIVVTFLALSGAYFFIQMKMEFDMSLYLPSDSYTLSYLKAQNKYFNKQRRQTRLYCGDFNYFEQSGNIDKLLISLQKSPYIENETTLFVADECRKYLRDENITITNEAMLNQALAAFLTSTKGMQYKIFVKFKFNSHNQPMSILATYMPLTHVSERDTRSKIKSMDNVRALVDSSGLPRFPEGSDDDLEFQCFVYSPAYLSYESGAVLRYELARNLVLAGAAVMIVTLLLIGNIRTTLLVFLCVVATVMDVGASLFLWGVTIDTSFSVLLALSVGLSVDYSAHVGHMFMTVTGDRNSRAEKTLAIIGRAVFNGGFSTFLSFVLLADSTSFFFLLFFKIFLTVNVFGLFHGLAFLPVMLSLLGPPPYTNRLSINRFAQQQPNSGEEGKVSKRSTSTKLQEQKSEMNGRVTSKINASSLSVETVHPSKNRRLTEKME